MKLKIFDASLWVFVASIFHFWSILFIIVVYIGILFHTARDYRAWFLPIIAFLTTSVLLLFFDLIFKTNNLQNAIANSATSFKIDYFVNNYQNLALSIFASVALFFIVNLALTISSRPNTLHSSHKKILFTFFIGLLVFLISPNKSNDTLIFTLAPLAFAMTIFFETPQPNSQKEVVFLALAGCGLFLFFAQL